MITADSKTIETEKKQQGDPDSRLRKKRNKNRGRDEIDAQKIGIGNSTDYVESSIFRLSNVCQNGYSRCNILIIQGFFAVPLN